MLMKHYNSIHLKLFMKLYNCAMIVQYLVQYTTISLSNGVSATHSVQVVGSAVCDCCELFR